jgi:hypothetical protein
MGMQDSVHLADHQWLHAQDSEGWGKRLACGLGRMNPAPNHKLQAKISRMNPAPNHKLQAKISRMNPAPNLKLQAKIR